MSITAKIGALLILISSMTNLTSAETLITFHRIPALGNPTTPMKISDDGKHIVGKTQNKAFYYSVKTDSIQVWTAQDGTFWDVTDSGRICGEVKNAAGFKEAVYIDLPSTELNFLGGVEPSYVPNSSGISISRAITSDGRFIAGHRYRLAGTAKISEAARWELNQGVVTVTGLAPAATANCTAYAISDDGNTVVGWQQTAQRSAAIWQNGIQTTFGGGTFNGLSTDGYTAIGAQGGVMASWNSQTGFNYHGKLEGDQSADGLDIAEDGMIVGISSNTSSGRTAVVWTAATGLIKFSDYLITLGAVLPTGWDFFNLNSVSLDGKIFTGFGYVPGYEGFSGWYVKVENISDINATNKIESQGSIISNYPNPFNPTTTVNYTLKQQAEVKMQILNSQGQLIKESAFGRLNAGNHQYNFKGDQLNSGIYFCNLIVNGNRIASHKMVFAK